MTSFLKRLFEARSNEAQPVEPVASDPPVDTAPLIASEQLEITPDEMVPSDIVGTPYVGGSVRIVSEEMAAELLKRKMATTIDLNIEQLKAWTCTQCGAPLPDLNAEATTVKCTSCGTVFRIPQTLTSRSGGVHISGSNVVVHGSIVGGDLVVTDTTQTKQQLFDEMIANFSKHENNAA